MQTAVVYSTTQMGSFNPLTMNISIPVNLQHPEALLRWQSIPSSSFHVSSYGPSDYYSYRRLVGILYTDMAVPVDAS